MSVPSATKPPSDSPAPPPTDLFPDSTTDREAEKLFEQMFATHDPLPPTKALIATHQWDLDSNVPDENVPAPISFRASMIETMEHANEKGMFELFQELLVQDEVDLLLRYLARSELEAADLERLRAKADALVPFLCTQLRELETQWITVRCAPACNGRMLQRMIKSNYDALRSLLCGLLLLQKALE